MEPVVLVSREGGSYHGHTTVDKLPTIELVQKSKDRLFTVTPAQWEEIAANPATRNELIAKYGKPIS